MSTPTLKFYGLFEYIFGYYNDHLFNSELKNCLIVITRKNNVMGHFSYHRWFSSKEHETDELAINPTYFVKHPLIEICQTMVHEMVHAWQFYYGTPSKKTYHNKEWAEKMEAIGLMPSSTGKPRGKKVGQKMSDYPIKDGLFLKTTEALMNENIFEGLFFEVNPVMIDSINVEEPLFDQIKDLTLVEEQIGEKKPNKNKVKYSCGCSNIWGKPDLNITCNICGEIFEII